ncbi:hypothetical protein E8E13_000942 [Curvularia kusanoi]|uniref:FAD-binding domain-containing protein n=1 Tax=Curvularia kusanoi TaxID=90978 RepID=A0A9P4W5Q4_CURKU|nr:hypothetical protein E8E13_000942 [Curvularia kusanoi]
MSAHEDGPSLAVVGGGIAGVLLTIALQKHCPQFPITLYESASAFGEIGAGVGFQPVMVRTMALIDPRIASAFENCIKGNEETDPPIWFTVRVGDTRKKGVVVGEEVFKIPSRKGPRGGVHRAHFLAELVKLIPEGTAKFGKRVIDVKRTEEGEALLKFADGMVAFSSRPTWEDPNWVVATSKEDMLNDYEHWGPKIRALMENVQSADIWALFNMPPASTYYRVDPLLCLVGDAAHASTPHQGSGAGMCVEDAYILSQVLAQCQSKDDIGAAFKAYDAVRRPRTQKLVKTSKEAGMLWEFEGEGVGDDLKAFEENAKTRMSWIWDHDISVDLKQAQSVMSEGS